MFGLKNTLPPSLSARQETLGFCDYFASTVSCLPFYLVCYFYCWKKKGHSYLFLLGQKWITMGGRKSKIYCKRKFGVQVNKESTMERACAHYLMNLKASLDRTKMTSYREIWSFFYSQALAHKRSRRYITIRSQFPTRRWYKKINFEVKFLSEHHMVALSDKSQNGCAIP